MRNVLHFFSVHLLLFNPAVSSFGLDAAGLVIRSGLFTRRQLPGASLSADVHRPDWWVTAACNTATRRVGKLSPDT